MSEETTSSAVNEEPSASETNTASAATESAADTPDASDTDTATETFDLSAEITKYRDIALRTKAEFENYRKRIVREKEEATRFANLALLENLLPVIDNFEMGLIAANNSPDKTISIGFSMVARQLNDFLESSGLTIIQAEGQKFDPRLHEAIGQEASADVPEGTVLRQMRKGYRMGDRLLRAANVIVAVPPAAA